MISEACPDRHDQVAEFEMKPADAGHLRAAPLQRGFGGDCKSMSSIRCSLGSLARSS